MSAILDHVNALLENVDINEINFGTNNQPDLDGKIVLDSSYTVERFKMAPGCFIETTVSTGDAKFTRDDILKAALYVCTGMSRLPEDHGNKLLEKYTPSTMLIRDHVDEMVKLGIIPPEAAIPAFNEFSGTNRNNLSFYAGTMLRFYPNYTGNIHPLLVMAMDYDDIPKSAREQSLAQWMELKAQNVPNIGDSHETFAKMAWLSSCDQLAILYAAIRKEQATASINLSHPSAIPLLDRAAEEHPFYERSLFLHRLKSLFFSMDYDSRTISMRVAIEGIDLPTFYKLYLPIISYIFAKIAKDNNLTPTEIVFCFDGFVVTFDDVTKNFYEDFKRNKNPIQHIPLPDFTPEVSLCDIQPSDIFPEK